MSDFEHPDSLYPKPKRIGFFIREEPYGFLSNFDRTPIVVDGKVFMTVEHFYQSQKAKDGWLADYIASAPNATIAMVLGRELEHNKYLQKYMEPEWDSEKKKEIMLKAQRAKYTIKALKSKLMATGDAFLFENNPDDFYWGIGDGTGENCLGRIIMQVREEIRCELGSQ